MLNLFYERLGSRSVLMLKGLNLLIPIIVFLYFLIVSSNISVPPTFNFYSELLLILSLLNIRNYIKVILGFIFLIVGIYNIFFYVSLNHRMNTHISLDLGGPREKEMTILTFHIFPLYISPLFFFLFCFFSLLKYLIVV